MGKHVNTKVRCFGCSFDFMTPKLKIPDEIYRCTKCNHCHIAGVDEELGTWDHEDFYENTKGSQQV